MSFRNALIVLAASAVLASCSSSEEKVRSAANVFLIDVLGGPNLFHMDNYDTRFEGIHSMLQLKPRNKPRERGGDEYPISVTQKKNCEFDISVSESGRTISRIVDVNKLSLNSVTVDRVAVGDLVAITIPAGAGAYIYDGRATSGDFVIGGIRRSESGIVTSRLQELKKHCAGRS